MREELAPDMNTIVEASCLLHASMHANMFLGLNFTGQLINSRMKVDLTPGCKRSCAVQYRSELQRSQANRVRYHNMSIVILLTEEWAWLQTTPSRAWDCEGFVDCLEFSLACMHGQS